MHGEPTTCTRCGEVEPRSEMFGLPDSLVCPACARDIGDRYRWNTTERTRPPFVSIAIVVVAGVLFVAAHVVHAPWIRFLVVDSHVWTGQAWRFLTSALLHTGPGFFTPMPTGLIHVGFNAWWILYLGRGIESRWGPWAMLALLIGSGAAGTAAQWLAGTPSVGLSGVVYGLAGFLYAWRGKSSVAATLMNPSTVRTLVMWFLICIFATQADVFGVANWGHGGGALWGYAAGIASQSARRPLAFAAVLTATLVLVAAASRPELQFRPERHHAGESSFLFDRPTRDATGTIHIAGVDPAVGTWTWDVEAIDELKEQVFGVLDRDAKTWTEGERARLQDWAKHPAPRPNLLLRLDARRTAELTWGGGDPIRGTWRRVEGRLELEGPFQPDPQFGQPPPSHLRWIEGRLFLEGDPLPLPLKRRSP